MTKRDYSRKSAVDFGRLEQSEREVTAKSRRPNGRKRKAVAIGPNRSPNFPAYVTDGANPDGTLRVRIFNSRAEADAAGFSWVGR